MDGPSCILYPLLESHRNGSFQVEPVALEIYPTSTFSDLLVNIRKSLGESLWRQCTNLILIAKGDVHFRLLNIQQERNQLLPLVNSLQCSGGRCYRSAEERKPKTLGHCFTRQSYTAATISLTRLTFFAPSLEVGPIEQRGGLVNRCVQDSRVRLLYLMPAWGWKSREIMHPVDPRDLCFGLNESQILCTSRSLNPRGGRSM